MQLPPHVISTYVSYFKSDFTLRIRGSPIWVILSVFCISMQKTDRITIYTRRHELFLTIYIYILDKTLTHITNTLHYGRKWCNDIYLNKRTHYIYNTTMFHIVD